MFRKTTFVVLAVLLATASAVYATPIVTMTESEQTRTQTTGAGSYHVLDFNFTMTPGAEFLNYRLNVTAATGSIMDPAKAQRDREDPDCTSCNGNTGGTVDTWMNTVASFTGKEADGNSASFVFNTYNPSSQSPPQPAIDWSVFDTVTGDGNTFGPNGYADTFTAPYHLARVVAQGSSGTWSVQAFDTATLNGTTFSGTWGTAVPEPATLSLLGLALVGAFGFIRRR